MSLFEEKTENVLRKVSLAEFEVYLNNYMKEDLKVGEKYYFSSYDEKDIHKIIRRNINKGFNEFCKNYELDEDFSKVFTLHTWILSLSMNYDMVSVYEDIGQYDIVNRKRKNASSMNSQFTLLEIPKFKLYTENKNVSMYDYFIGLLEEKRNKNIEHYKKEIMDWEKNIENNMREIHKLRNLDIE